MEERTYQLKKIHINTLSTNELLSIETAINFLDKAYAPYSNFRVSSAVLMEDGTIYGGANQENASYSLCMCAERVALYHAVMSHPILNISAIAITAKSKSQKIISPAMPCGACRQVILEYERRNEKDIKLFFINDDREIFTIDSIKGLLPHSFDGSIL